MSWQQLNFGFDELPEAKEVPAPFFKEPKNDNERLLNMQYEYRHGDKLALKKMYRLGCTVAQKMISAKANKNRHIAGLSPSEKWEKAHNAITYIIEQYIKRSGFVITDSFTAYIYLRVQHELFYRRKVDRIVEFVDMETFYRGAK